MVKFLIVEAVFAWAIMAIIFAGHPAPPPQLCPQGYYCMTNSDEMAMQHFIDTRCTKLDHGRY